MIIIIYTKILYLKKKLTNVVEMVKKGWYQIMVKNESCQWEGVQDYSIFLKFEQKKNK